MAETLIALKQPFEYAEEDVPHWIAHAEEQVAKWTKLQSHSDEVLRQAAGVALPNYQVALAFAKPQTPQGMIGKLREIFNTAERLESSDAPREQIENTLNQNYGDRIFFFRDLINRDWIEVAFQRVVTARGR